MTDILGPDEANDDEKIPEPLVEEEAAERTEPQLVSVPRVQQVASSIIREVSKAIVGQDEVIETMLAALFAGGHALLEGPPGSAKTLAARAISCAIQANFKRIQFTPDLMPSDITGLRIFDASTSQFLFRPGPIFTDILLADEINRTPPKTQAALLEAMQEGRVSADGETLTLPPLFTVFATQNPIEFEGTYPLPEAQIDRFLLKIVVDYPSAADETQVLKRIHNGFDPNNLSRAGLLPAATSAEILECREIAAKTTLQEALFKYIIDIVNATRKHPHVALGGSPRASISLLSTSKALASIRGRDYVIPDDIKFLAKPVLRHRLILKPEAQIEGVSLDRVIEGILDKIEAPR